MSNSYFTNKKVAEHCAKVFNCYIPENAIVVEPSAGEGVFIPYTDIWMDIVPLHDNVKEQDFFEFDTTEYRYYLGNPPYGTKSDLAIRFFNHAALGCGVIGFILPRSIRKASMYKSLDKNFHLVYEEILPHNSFTNDDEVKHIDSVFQVWEYRDVRRIDPDRPTTHNDFTFVKETEYYDFSICSKGNRVGEIRQGAPVANSLTSNYYIRGDVFEVFEKMKGKLKELSQDTIASPSVGKADIVYTYTEEKKND